MAFLFQRSDGVYCICHSKRGKKMWLSTGKTNHSEALRELIRFEDSSILPTQTTTMGEFKSDLLNHLKTTVAKKTYQIYDRALTQWLAVIGKKELTSITPRDADRYRTVKAEHLSPVSVNIDLRALKAAFGIALRWKLLPENPFNEIKQLRVPEQPPRYFSRQALASR